MSTAVCAEELNVGIAEYASPQVEGFYAISKARYSDFIVHEVDLNGHIALLKTLHESFPDEMKQDIASHPEETISQPCSTLLVPSPDPPSSYSVEEKLNIAQLKLAELVGQQEAKAAMEIIRFWEVTDISDDDKQMPKNYTFPISEDKQSRKQIHDLFRSEFFSILAVSDTVHQSVRVWHKKFEKDAPNYRTFNGQSDGSTKREKRQSWPKERSDYVQFVLYKENIDTTTAIRDISRILHLQPKFEGRGTQSSIGYAGMKDKRGITSQFCTVYRKTPQELDMINHARSKNQCNAVVGGGHTHGGGISFIRVGDYVYTTRPLELGKLSGNRFDIVLRNVFMDDLANYQDLNLNKRISLIKNRLRSSLQGLKDIGFINYFGMQRFGKDHDTHEVGLAVLKQNFEKACDIIMRLKPGDDTSKDSRIKWESRFAAVNMDDEPSVCDAEAKCAKLLLKQLGRFMNAEIAIMDRLSRKPRDYRSAFLGISRHLRSMYLHSYQSCVWNKVASHRIKTFGAQVMEGDLVLLAGDGDEDESNTTSWDEKKVKIVTAEDIDQYTIHDVVLPLVGSKVTYPTNVIEYYDSLLQDDGLDRTFFVKNQDRETVLRGDYRKLLCKPMDVDHRLILYKDPMQPLLQTDLMRLNDVGIENVIYLHDTELEIADDGNQFSWLGITISFTLPQSAYATIALREFLKRPTSGVYQASLPMIAEGFVAKIDPDGTRTKKQKSMSESQD